MTFKMKAPNLGHNTKRQMIAVLVAGVTHMLPPMHLSRLSTTSKLRRGANRGLAFTNHDNTAVTD
jgi:hypothetical protein